jgi:hypothetical protein
MDPEVAAVLQAALEKNGPATGAAEIGDVQSRRAHHGWCRSGGAVHADQQLGGLPTCWKPGRVVLDPSRMAAQLVTGAGFLGAGLIFVRRDSVRGLTTAAASG